MHYQQLDFDTSYVAYFTVDSILVSHSTQVNYPNGERLHIFSKVSPYHYSLRRSYNSADSSYTYNYLIHNGDTNITDNLTHRFRDIDSAYECESYSYETRALRGFTKRFEKSHSDSSYGYNSTNGGNIGWEISNDTFSIAKGFKLKGDLVSKHIKRFTDGAYDVEEILERQDTFYHVVNYYHKLHWKKDTNNVTSYFPYLRQVYLNEDSVVTKELNYSFETENDWPTLTIMEGDSIWTENTSGGFSSKFARKVFICPGAITTGSAIYKAHENTFNFTGVGGKRVRKRLINNANAHFDLMFGVGVPPLYFTYAKGSGSPHHSFSMPNSRNYQSFNKILSESATRRASLYINGELKKIDCTFLKLDFNYSLQVKRVKRS